MENSYDEEVRRGARGGPGGQGRGGDPRKSEGLEKTKPKPITMARHRSDDREQMVYPSASCTHNGTMRFEVVDLMLWLLLNLNLEK